MSNKAIHPTTMAGIKRLATCIKREKNLQHTQALDLASQQAGFENFRHAENAFKNGHHALRQPSGHTLYITGYWKDHSIGTSGRETLPISLPVPWDNLITQAQLQNHRSLMHLRKEGPDHLALNQLLASQSETRRAICATARVFLFMSATKLRPSKSHSRAYPNGRSSNSIPGQDHASTWYDSTSKRYLIADEPYEQAAIHLADRRELWARQYNALVIKPNWAGMYAPDVGSRLYLITDATKGIPLQDIVIALNQLPPPIVESTWHGESAPRAPIFISPGSAAKEPPKQTLPQPQRPLGRNNTVEYTQTFVGPRRRPNGKMPIASHAEVGRLLKSVLAATYHRKGVYNRVNTVRSDLDEWTQREYNHDELPNEQFFNLYYHETISTIARSLPEKERDAHIKTLQVAQKILIKHYPDCQPLRFILKQLDAAIGSLQTWA